MEVYDVSVDLSEDTVVYPGDPKIRFRALSDIRKDGVAVSEVSMGLHSGTHVDAPSHYVSGGKSIDELSPIVGSAKVLDLSAVEDEISVCDISASGVSSGDIVLLKTRNSRLWKNKKFSEKYVSLSALGAEYLVRKKVAAVGIDYLSIEAFDSAEGSVHKILLSNNIPIIEGLDLCCVEAGAYTCVCLPLKLAGGEAAPARCVLVKSSGL